jgi:hypothetical protein
MRRLVAVVVLFTSLAACGDNTKHVTAGDEPSGAIAQPGCVENNDGYDYTADPDHVGAQQTSLRADAETVRRYGEGHPEDFTQVAFENRPSVRLLGVFTDHLDEHRAALQPQLQHPDQFEVRKGALTARDAQAIQKTLNEEAPFAHQWNSNGSGGLDFHVNANFFATADGRSAAAAARQRWGDVMCLTIAGHPFPKGAWPDTSTCPADPAPTDRNTAVDFKLVLDKTTLQRGEVGTGTGRVTNNGTVALEAMTGGYVGANVTAPGSQQILGSSSGAQTLEAVGRHADPGQTLEMPIRFGTEDCRADSDYALPAGEYVVSSYLKGFGRSDDVTITILDS